MDDLKAIHINIWDDFDTKIKSTYAYVEESNLSSEQCFSILESLLTYIKRSTKIKTDDISLVFHDTKDDYDSITVQRAIEAYGSGFFFKRYEIQFKNITDIQIQNLIKKIKKDNVSYNNIPLNVYSES